MSNPKVIALAAGGTGGHFFPAEALAGELIARGHRIVIYTDKRGEKYASKLPNAEMVSLPASMILPGIFGKLKTAAIILRAAHIARRHMRSRRVAMTVAFGGYPCFAPALAGRSLRLPLILHEQATKVSLANQRLLSFATRLATSFPQVSGSERLRPQQIVQTGNPVRAAILASRDEPYLAPGEAGTIRLLVVGGSQSARVFGEVVPGALALLPEALRARVQLSLQYAGEDAAAKLAELQAAGITARIEPFFTDMPEQLAKCHLVITRAGASTAAELLVVGRPSILVPIPQGGSRVEQLRNAETLEMAGVGWCQRQESLTPATLAVRLTELLQHPERLAEAAAKAHALGQPQAARHLADLVESVLG